MNQGDEATSHRTNRENGCNQEIILLIILLAAAIIATAYIFARTSALVAEGIRSVM